MRVSIHQSLFIPWFPYFEKMEQSDVFVILTDCQYEKGSCLNRQKIDGKWWTKPVQSGLVPIIDKHYVSGQSLLALNMRWIYTIAETLEINTEKIKYDFPTKQRGTERLIEICQRYGGDEYLADASAPEKYLDVKALEESGIRFVPFKSNHRVHTFDMFREFGIEKTVNILKHGGSNGIKKLEEDRKENAEGGTGGSPKASEEIDKRVVERSIKE